MENQLRMRKMKHVRTEAFKVYGLAVEKYVGDVAYGHNCDFTYVPEELTRYVVLAKAKINNWEMFAKITLRDEFGECGSGWTTATWGLCKTEISFDEPFHYPFNYKPIKDVFIALENEDSRWSLPEDDTDAPIRWSSDGGDCYYPNGGVYVDMECFEKNVRAFEERPVWIFTGASGIGKSTLGAHLKGMQVYETDGDRVLPDVITADVIILGNRDRFTVDDVKKKIFNAENAKIIVCSFSVDS